MTAGSEGHFICLSIVSTGHPVSPSGIGRDFLDVLDPRPQLVVDAVARAVWLSDCADSTLRGILCDSYAKLLWAPSPSPLCEGDAGQGAVRHRGRAHAPVPTAPGSALSPWGSTAHHPPQTNMTGHSGLRWSQAPVFVGPNLRRHKRTFGFHRETQKLKFRETTLKGST